MGGHDHDHSHATIRSAARHRGRLAAALGVLTVFMVVEVTAAITTNSLALLSDAGHMLTDVVGMGMALVAISLASRGSTRRDRTFGLYRLEILAVLVNVLLLVGVAIYVVIEAIGRLGTPVEVLSTPMLVVAVLGLGANLFAFFMLRGGAKESMNVEGAYLEAMSDTVGSVGVIIAAIVIRTVGWTWVDPVVGVAIGLFILPRAVRLGGRALRVMMQAAPADLDLDAITSGLSALDGVIDVHDFHVWTLTSNMEVASAHIVVGDTVDHHRVLDQARDLLRDDGGITHATLQIEPESHTGCTELDW